jgi:hypothetical protein
MIDMAVVIMGKYILLINSKDKKKPYSFVEMGQDCSLDWQLVRLPGDIEARRIKVPSCPIQLSDDSGVYVFERPTKAKPTEFTNE